MIVENRPPWDRAAVISRRPSHWLADVSCVRRFAGLPLETLAKAVAVTLQEQDVTAVDQPIQEGCGHLFMAKHLRPVRKVEVGGERDAGAFVAVGTASSIMRGSLLLTWNSTNSAQGAVWSQQ
jgi:hypothetical protein